LVVLKIARHKLFGITGAATPPQNRLSRTNCTATNSLGSRVRRHVGIWFVLVSQRTATNSLGSRVRRPPAPGGRSKVCCPPQTLWDHGCGDASTSIDGAESARRHKLFGITGAATRRSPAARPRSLSATNSLGSRVRRRKCCVSGADDDSPPQTLWDHGCGDPASCDSEAYI